MAHRPFEARPVIPSSKGSSIACVLFVGALGAAFWIGAIWASHAWTP
jgi:hypothetical protein